MGTQDWIEADWRKWAIEQAIAAGAIVGNIEWAAQNIHDFVFRPNVFSDAERKAFEAAIEKQVA